MSVVYKSDIVPVRVDPTLRVAIHAAAKREGVSVSEYLRVAASNEIAKSELKYTVADVSNGKAAEIDDRLSVIELVLKQIATDVKMMMVSGVEADKNIGVLMRRQEKMRNSDATNLETLEKIGILVANMAKPLGLPKIFDALVDDLTKPKA